LISSDVTIDKNDDDAADTGIVPTTITIAVSRYDPASDISGTGHCFRSISLFFVSFFVSLLARLRENGRTDLHEIFREGAE